MTLVLKPLSKAEFLEECDKFIEDAKTPSRDPRERKHDKLFWQASELTRHIGDDNAFYVLLQHIFSTVPKENRPKEFAIIIEQLKAHVSEHYQEQ